MAGENRLDGQVALVSGGSRGIGRATAPYWPERELAALISAG
jgi:NADP-dependent 3-hydroxy acid dehydrogenase YdfG